jgi:hypothetical protein
MDYKLRTEIFKAIASRIYDIQIVEKLADSIMHDIEISGTLADDESQISKSNEQQAADSEDMATDIKAIRASLERMCNFIIRDVGQSTITINNEDLLKRVKDWNLRK